MKVLVLLVRHGTSRYPAAIDRLQLLYREQLPATSYELVVADTAQGPSAVERDGDGFSVLGAPNTAWEFSGWDHAIAQLGPRIFEFDLVNLVTDAFEALGTAHLELIDETMLSTIAGRSAALGHIDFFNTPVELFGHRSQSWLRTSFILLPTFELTLLGSLVSVTGRDDLFSANAADPFKTDAPLSADLRRYIIDWLTGPGTGQGVTWHSRMELSAADLDRFEAKATAVLNEQALTFRLRAQGCRPVDLTWLSKKLKSDPAWPGWPVPEWREQLKERLSAIAAF